MIFCPFRADEETGSQCAETCAMFLISDDWEGCALVRIALDVSKSQGLNIESVAFEKGALK
jgi:hypothetical protein